MGKFMPHTILQRKGKRGSVVKGRGENARDGGSQKRTGETLENTGSYEQRIRRVTFVLDYFSVSREGE
jgi:hypothetical protein